MNILRIIFIILLYSINMKAFSIDKIYIDFQNRPPFFEINSLSNKLDEGILYKLTKKICEKAKIPIEFAETPLPRTISRIKDQKERVCFSYALDDPTRKEFSYISLPYFQEKRNVVVFRKNDLKIPKIKTMKSLLEDKNITLLIKRGYSYGMYIDKLLFEIIGYSKNQNYENETQFKQIYITYLDNVNMLKQIELNRSDYMILSLTEYEYLSKQNKNTVKHLNYKYLDDLKEGYKRFFVCSKLIETDTIEKLNKSIINTVGKL
ncbi:substrate-binding periplasmic protein [Silvanigrella aquatica]|uniref:Uncharacterized protein n=1 Tax=Silvanigrella aquatica TaxID=1915309 RepID=A0A1L4D3N3_9BACT|nr:transporter substrate-binding domain-containing protein [Silvanigrella aquatica]APJ04824.1 hypothetical protein AXG55_13315 [Silvanigrella aquatica]